MTPEEITSARKAIRPLLMAQLSLLNTIYAPSDPRREVVITQYQEALVALDELVRWAKDVVAEDETPLPIGSGTRTIHVGPDLDIKTLADGLAALESDETIYVSADMADMVEHLED